MASCSPVGIGRGETFLSLGDSHRHGESESVSTGETVEAAPTPMPVPTHSEESTPSHGAREGINETGVSSCPEAILWEGMMVHACMWRPWTKTKNS
jgi:hypothetical protein